MAKNIPAGTRRSLMRLNGSFDRRYERKAIETDAIIVSGGNPDASGRPMTYTVQQSRNGTLTPNVPASGAAGEGIGARVRMVGKRLSAPNWRIVSVSEPVTGGNHTDPNAFYSTPSIVDIVSVSAIGNDGTDSITSYVTLLCVPEHYNGRVRTTYDIEVRDAENPNLDPLPIVSSLELERVAGVLQADISAGEVDEIDIFAYGVTGYPELRGLASRVVLQIGDERIFCGGVTALSPTVIRGFDAVRGYTATPAAAHVAGSDVYLRGLTIAALGLLPNHNYQVRARARANEGRVSNWTDWDDFITALDTTPPTWSTAPITPTIASTGGGIRLEWIPADVAIGDLAGYQVQVASDAAFTLDVALVGLLGGTYFIYDALIGTIRHFRVRAVDRSGNTSPWSNGVRGVVGLPDEPVGTNIAPNPSFATNTTGWTYGGVGSFARDAAVYFDAAGSGRITENRVGFGETPFSLLGTSFGIAGGREYYVRAWAAGSNLNSGDVVRLIVRQSAGGSTLAVSEIAITGDRFPANRFVPLVLPVYFAPNMTTATLELAGTLAAGSGSVQIWLDDIYVVPVTGAVGGVPTLSTNMSGNRLAPTRGMASNGATRELILTNVAALDFPNMATGTEQELAITVSGAADGDDCRAVPFVTTPFSALEAGLSWSAWVSAANTVTVRLRNNSASSINPVSRSWRATVRHLE